MGSSPGSHENEHEEFPEMPPTPPPTQVGLTGARFGRSARADPHAVAAPPDDPDRPAPGARFDVVIRGYERDQVDAFVRSALADGESLRDALAAAEEKYDRVQRRAAEVETENQALRRSTPTDAVESGFGVRAERLLRLAETEAAELRAQAARDAADLMERSRVDAEHHRHEVEQALIARVAELDQAAARRDAEIADREEQAARRLDAARAEADRVNTVALRDAERVRRDAEAAAEHLRTALRAEVDRLREETRAEVDRLAGMRDDALRDIRRLTDVLVAEGAPQPRHSAGPGRSAAVGPPGRREIDGAGVPRALPAGAHAVAAS